jgi:predicted transcriptional regulator
MTKRNFYEVIKAVAQDMQGNDSEYVWGTVEDTPVKNEDVINFCNHEMELLDNRVNKKKPSKLADENTLNAVYDIVKDNAGADCTRVAQAMGWNTQKATPYLKKLVADGRLTVTKVKGRNTYTIV